MPTSPDDAAGLQALLDKQAIHEVLMRYCRGIDRCDAELLRGVYHDDATDDHGGFKGAASDFVTWAIDALRRDESTTHYIANELVDLQGDVAFAESYFFAVHRRTRKSGAKVDIVFAGRYVDRFERRAGSWKIADRKVVYDRSRVDPVDEEFSNDAFIAGQRDRSDPVYRR